jgi:hypothetical protein
MSEEKTKDLVPPTPAPDAPRVPEQGGRLPNKKTPNLKWAAATFVLGGIVSYYLCLGNNWGVPDTYMVLAGHLIITIGSILAIFYERDAKPFMGVPHRAYLLYGIFLLLGSAIAATALGLGNVLVPFVIPFTLVPVVFYALLVTTLVLSVEFGISIVKNFRK